MGLPSSSTWMSFPSALQAKVHHRNSEWHVDRTLDQRFAVSVEVDVSATRTRHLHPEPDLLSGGFANKARHPTSATAAMKVVLSVAE